MIYVLIMLLIAAAFAGGYMLGSHKSVPQMTAEAEAAAEEASTRLLDAIRLEAITERFKAEFDDIWGPFQSQPLAHGIEQMIRRLKGLS